MSEFRKKDIYKYGSQNISKEQDQNGSSNAPLSYFEVAMPHITIFICQKIETFMASHLIHQDLIDVQLIVNDWKMQFWLWS